MKRSRLILAVLLLSLLAGACGKTLPSPTAVPTQAAIPTQTVVPVVPTLPAAPAATSAPAGPAAVKPVSGLPAGTDNYPWWNDSIFYEIFVRSFYDSNGDGIGDFNGITARLDYLKQLGVSGLWLMPVNPSPSYHGYDVTDFYAVNPDYGSLDDFKRLLSEAHKRGIRVILDLVLNHTSNQHPWFKAAQDPKSPYHDWYIWSDNPPDTVNWHDDGKYGYYYGYFCDCMPDLNYKNPAVTQEMDKVVSFWLKDVGIDGFRLDAAKYLIEEGSQIQNTDATHLWYKDFHSLYKGLNPQAMTVGEVWDISPTAASYAQGDQLDLTFDFSLSDAMIVSTRTGSANQVNQVMAADLKVYKPLQMATFLSNHDQNRIISQLFNKLEKARPAAAMLMTSPGVPFIYYGEEIGMTGIKPDPDLRRPMQWSADLFAGFTTGLPWRLLPYDYRDGRNVADEEKDPNSLLNYYRTLVGLRNQHAALRVGDYLAVTSSDGGLYACLRYTPEETILVLVNLSDKDIDNFSLSLPASKLSGEYQAGLLLGQGQVSAPKLNAQGGWDAYQPLASIPANRAVEIQLAPIQK